MDEIGLTAKKDPKTGKSFFLVPTPTDYSLVTPEYGAVPSWYPSLFRFETPPTPISCAGLAVWIAGTFYGDDLGKKEHIFSDAKKVYEYNIPNLDLKAYTPGQIARGAAKIPNSQTIKFSEHLNSPAIDAMSGGGIKDKNPNE